MFGCMSRSIEGTWRIREKSRFWLIFTNIHCILERDPLPFSYLLTKRLVFKISWCIIVTFEVHPVVKSAFLVNEIQIKIISRWNIELLTCFSGKMHFVKPCNITVAFVLTTSGGDNLGSGKTHVALKSSLKKYFKRRYFLRSNMYILDI